MVDHAQYAAVKAEYDRSKPKRASIGVGVPQCYWFSNRHWAIIRHISSRSRGLAPCL
jgi:hypothetical protein